MSVVSKLVEAYNELHHEMNMAPDQSPSSPNRDFALARTAIEEAIFRTNVGFSKRQGNYYMSDAQANTQHIPHQ